MRDGAEVSRVFSCNSLEERDRTHAPKIGANEIRKKFRSGLSNLTRMRDNSFRLSNISIFLLEFESLLLVVVNALGAPPK